MKSWHANVVALGDGLALVIHPRFGPKGRRVVIGTHGHGGDWSAWCPTIFAYGPIAALVERGFTVIASNAGGAEGWSTAASQTALDNAYNYAVANLAMPSTKVGHIGYSMGSAASAIWAMNNPTKTAGLYSVNGVLDLEFVHTVGYAAPYSMAGITPGAYASVMNTAYGSPWATTSANRNPLTRAADLRGTPCRLIHAGDDTTLPPAADAYFAGLVNDPKTTFDVTSYNGGHTNVFDTASPIDKALPSYLVADWFDQVASW